jgi:hypothetical protein
MSSSLGVEDKLAWVMVFLLELPPPTLINKQKKKGNKKMKHIVTLKRHLQFENKQISAKIGVGVNALKTPNI